MPMALPKTKAYLSPADRERIHGELKELRLRRRATSEIGVTADVGHRFYKPPEMDVDDGALAMQENHLKQVLERESPPKLSDVQRNSAYSEFKTLVREYEDHALTKYDQGLGYPEIMKRSGACAEGDYERAKKKCIAWEMGDRGSYVGHRLKQLAGVIDPDNPELRRLDNFRKRK